MKSKKWMLDSVLARTAAVAVVSMGLAGAVHAEEAADDGIPGEFSATVGLYSEYVFRGISYSDEDPSIQGGLTWSHETGIYAGFWGTNGEFGTGGSLELDYFIGYGNEVNGVSYDISVTYYTYPGDEVDGNYFEFMGKLGYDLGLAAISGGIAYTPSGQDAFAGEDAFYFFSDLEVPIPNTPFTAAFHVGYTDIKGGSYVDYSAGLYASVAGLDLGVVFIDTDIKAFDPADSRVVFSISKSF
jgi:uncharacterized protein (TIGR02001 family)